MHIQHKTHSVAGGHEKELVMSPEFRLLYNKPSMRRWKVSSLPTNLMFSDSSPHFLILSDGIIQCQCSFAIYNHSARKIGLNQYLDFTPGLQNVGFKLVSLWRPSILQEMSSSPHSPESKLCNVPAKHQLNWHLLTTLIALILTEILQ